MGRTKHPCWADILFATRQAYAQMLSVASAVIGLRMVGGVRLIDHFRGDRNSGVASWTKMTATTCGKVLVHCGKVLVQ